MDEIFDSLVQTIDEGSYQYISPMGEYRREQHCAGQHLQWLEEHLNGEEKAHLEGLRNAEVRVATLEYEALVKVAIAAGIRLALPQ